MQTTSQAPERMFRKASYAVVGGVAIAVLLVSPASNAANATKKCSLHIESHRELGKLAEFPVTVRCDGGQQGAMPVNEPLLIGLTATTSAEREEDRVEIEYDFPLQHLVVLPDTAATTLTFHAQLADVAGKTHVYAMAWPLTFLQDCAGGRSGCRRFGYALAAPASLAKVCFKKDEAGETEATNDIRCKELTDTRFKFR